jgi:hypothetical protein
MAPCGLAANPLRQKGSIWPDTALAALLGGVLVPGNRVQSGAESDFL